MKSCKSCLLRPVYISWSTWSSSSQLCSIGWLFSGWNTSSFVLFDLKRLWLGEVCTSLDPSSETELVGAVALLVKCGFAVVEEFIIWKVKRTETRWKVRYLNLYVRATHELSTLKELYPRSIITHSQNHKDQKKSWLHLADMLCQDLADNEMNWSRVDKKRVPTELICFEVFSSV